MTSDSEPTNPTARQLLEEIIALGFYRFAQPNRVNHMKARFLRAPDLWNQVHAKRDYPADEERLAECGVGTFIREIEPILKAAGVSLWQVEEDCSRVGYRITVNGVEYELYSEQDIIAAENQSGGIWGMTTRRAFALINKLLMENGSDERIYSYNGGNDHWAFILPEALHSAFCRSGVVEEAKQLVLYLPNSP